jgi:hypothetical protein
VPNDALAVISAARDCIVAFAAVVTATVAVKGLNRWQRELRGKAAFDAARSLARATYRLRDEIGNCRQPLITGNEFPTEYPHDDRDRSPSIDANAYLHIFSNRWKPVYAALQEFDAQALEAEAIWGADIRGRTDAMRKLVRQLDVAITQYIGNLADDYYDPHDLPTLRPIMFASRNDTENTLSMQLSDAVHAIEDQLLPHLRRS